MTNKFDKSLVTPIINGQIASKLGLGKIMTPTTEITEVELAVSPTYHAAKYLHEKIKEL